MKKKTKIILIIIAVLVIAIPIGVFAARELIVIPNLDEEAIKEANQKETNRALEEKANFAREHANDTSSNTSTLTNENVVEEETPAAKQARENAERLETIVKQYYPEEYNNLKNGSSSENQGLVDIKNSQLTNQQRNLYNVVLKILEEKSLSTEDRDLLKDYIRGQMYEIEKDDSLATRANAVLQ